MFRADGEQLSFIGSQRPKLNIVNANMPRGISIDDGATYTNDREVEVRVPEFWHASSFSMSNERSLFPAQMIRIEEGVDRYRWQLSPGPGRRSVKHVYVRYTDSFEYSDDIILDERDPQVLSAKLARKGRGSRLLLRARDNRSGVRKLQLTTRRSRPGRPRRFSKSLRVRGKPRRLYVRVMDGAGNRSRWRVARR